MNQLKTSKKISKDQFFYIISIVYVVFMICANVMASKIISVGGFIIDAGTLTYPFTFMIGDVLADLYGYKPAKKIILWGFAANFIFSIFCMLGTFVPGLYADDALTNSYNILFSYNIRILIAGFLGYIFGTILNAASLVWIKKITGEKWLALRTIGSTVLGAAVDTALFTVIAWVGSIPVKDMIIMGLSGYVVKIIFEAIIATPLDYALLPIIRKKVEGFSK